jgi:hypothetical protein
VQRRDARGAGALLGRQEERQLLARLRIVAFASALGKRDRALVVHRDAVALEVERTGDAARVRYATDARLLVQSRGSRDIS